MINFPIVDAHLHLWDPARLRYAWLDANPLLNQPYLLDQYRRACGPVQVEQMVFLQCECDFAQFMEEADWVTRLAREDARLTGIVPWAPLEKGEAARSDLERLAANPLVKGIRRIIQFEPDPEFCLRPDFVAGVQAVPDYGLHFELCISHGQLANTLKLVAQCPNTRFILDHIGKPDIKQHLYQPWKQELRTLASFPNVWCKVSGLVTEADHQHWVKEDLKTYIDHVLECFGFGRVVFGSDWPVVLQAAELPRWVETLAWAVSGCSDTELHQLFRDNAKAFYRLA
jgi:L-fuconolactonase